MDADPPVTDFVTKFFFFSSRRRHTRSKRDWSSDVCSSDLLAMRIGIETIPPLLLVGTRHLVTGLILYPFLRVRAGIRPSAAHWGTAAVTGILLLFVRSEERRVGKECRSRLSAAESEKSAGR